MTSKISPMPNKRIPYWVVQILVAITTCVGANLLTIGFEFGAFVFWGSLKSPPSGAIKIIDADRNNIWVEANNGQLFTANVNCFENKECRKWNGVSSISDIKPFHEVPARRGANCESIRRGPFPNDPWGKVVECILAPYPGPELGTETYYALMSDGTIKDWFHGSDTISALCFFLVSTVILPILAIILASSINQRKRVAAKSEKAS